MGYATTVMKQPGPSHAVGDKIIEARSALSRTNQCTRADGKGVLQSYKNKFHVPLTSPTSLEMLKNGLITQNPFCRANECNGDFSPTTIAPVQWTDFRTHDIKRQENL